MLPLWFYDGHGRRILYEVDETGLEPSFIASYVYGINLIARLEGISGSTAYYFYNGHGDVTGLVDIYGVLIGSFDYEAFGDVLEETGIGETPFKYAGEYLDRETEMIYLGARYYNPVIGRFTAEDPHWNPSNMIYGDNPVKIDERQDLLGLVIYTYAPDINAIRQSENLYVYGMNNPVMYIDSDGEIAMIATTLIGAAAGAIIGGGIDAATQLMSGKSLHQLDRKSMGISAGSGAISGALAGSGIGLGTAIVANAALSGTTTIVRQTMYGEKIDWARVGIDTGIGALAGWFGGAGAQHGVNRAFYEVKNVGTAFQSVVKVTYKNPTAALAVKNELTKALVKLGLTNITITVKDEIVTITTEGAR